jgi:hypothetical protein
MIVDIAGLQTAVRFTGNYAYIIALLGALKAKYDLDFVVSNVDSSKRSP